MLGYFLKKVALYEEAGGYWGLLLFGNNGKHLPVHPFLTA
jgi:hypothetical protein